MKKSILSFVLAVVLLATMFVLPVSAAVSEGEALQPQYEVVRCPGCNQSVRVRVSESTDPKVEPACELGGAMVHTHEYVTTTKTGVCPNCGEFPLGSSTAKYCQGIRIH